MMRKHLKKRRNVTLIEMMIVMFLIALITGVVAYNYKGSLDQGKVFKAKQAMSRIENVVNMAMAQDSSFDVKDWQEAIKNSSLINDPSQFLKDPWGGEYQVSLENGSVIVTSDNYEKHNTKK